MAFSEGARAPRLRDIGLAVLIAVTALVALLRLGDVVKLAGAALYWLPVRLGLLRQADASWVWRYDLRQLPEVLDFPAAGRYLVYTSDYDLLVVTSTLQEEQLSPWLAVSNVATAQRSPTYYVTRGMRAYDSHLAPGRPVFGVVIPQAGRYSVEGTHRPAEIALVRDYVTGNERRIVSIFMIELLLLVAPLAWFYGRPYLLRQRALRARQRARRAEVDVFFERLQEKRRAQPKGATRPLPPDDSDPHAPYRR